MSQDISQVISGLIPTRNLYALAARWSVLVNCTWGALFGLFVPTTLIYRLHDRYDLLDYLNAVVLAICALGWADVIWHDIRGRLLLPRIKPKLRHKVCVMTYSLLGASWVIKAFGHAASTDIPGALPLAIYALSMSTACGMVALALALERR
jgi:hypothetical protein